MQGDDSGASTKTLTLTPLLTELSELARGFQAPWDNLCAAHPDAARLEARYNLLEANPFLRFLLTRGGKELNERDGLQLMKALAIDLSIARTLEAADLAGLLSLSQVSRLLDVGCQSWGYSYVLEKTLPELQTAIGLEIVSEPRFDTLEYAGLSKQKFTAYYDQNFAAEDTLSILEKHAGEGFDLVLLFHPDIKDANDTQIEHFFYQELPQVTTPGAVLLTAIEDRDFNRSRGHLVRRTLIERHGKALLGETSCARHYLSQRAPGYKTSSQRIFALDLDTMRSCASSMRA